MRKKLIIGLFTVVIASFFLMGVSAESFDLLAGKDMKVGVVEVSNDENTLFVNYKIEEEGWCLVETHLQIGDDLGDFPLVGKNKNPVPGQFEYKESHDCILEHSYEITLESEAGDELLVAAHAVVEKISCNTLVESPYGASEVVSYEQGLRYDNTSVRTERSNPNATLTFETGKDETNFFSLGFGGEIVLRFDSPIKNGVGDDLRIVEDTWGLPYPNETAKVWVKAEEGDSWVYLGEANNQNPYLDIHTITNFDLENVGLDYVKFVKIEDNSNKENFASLYPRQSNTLDGYDLNAVLALHNYEECEVIESETAWSEGERFTKRGNWATYSQYTVEGITYIETVIVPSNGTEVSSSKSLDENSEYLLIANGTYRFANWGKYGIADSEWAYRYGPYHPNGTSGWVKGEGYYNSECGLDVQVDGSCVDWGSYNSSHTYSLSYNGTGNPISFYIYDNVYSDNSGNISVEIYKIY